MPIKGPNSSMKKRIRIMIALMAGLGFSMVAVRLFYMQVIQHEFYQEQATTLQTRDTVVTPKRGTIYDRNMKELAVSAGTEMVVISPKTVLDANVIKKGEVTKEEQQQKLAKILAEQLDLDYDKVLKKVQKKSSYEIIKKGVEQDTLKTLKEALSAAKCAAGVTTEPDSKRYYPYGSFASQVIGFVDDDGKGTWGIESQYDDVLRGAAGRVVQARNAQGGDMPFEYEQYITAENGGSVVLTIDEAVQHFLEKNLETAMEDNPQARGGVSGIVMNVKTGEILAMANKPDFDLNQPRQITSEKLLGELQSNINKAMTAEGVSAAISEAYLKEGGAQNLSDSDKQNEKLVDLLTKERANELYKMWKNKIITDTYEPGSTFKLMNVASAVETQAVSQSDHFFCGGSLKVAGWGKPIKCWKTAGHGDEDLMHTLMNSCNVAMMQIAFKNGPANFYEYFDAFGLNKKTGIDLPGEASNNSLYFTQKSLTETPSNLAVSSFGQRFQVTPMQMLMMVDAIVDDGKLKTPHMVKEVLDSEGNVKQTIGTNVVRQVVSEDTSAFMRQAMEQVVSGGTGANAYVAGYRVGGKTATSEIQKQPGDAEDRYTASFIGVAPMDDPEIIVLVAVSDLPQSAVHGGGAVAAPVVARVMSDALPYLGVEAVYSEEEADRREITTPTLVGKTAEEAEKLLKEAGMEYKLVGSGDKVTDQVPSSGAKVPVSARAVVYLGGAKSSEQRSVPDVRGLSPAEALDRLQSAGLYMKRTGIATKQTGYMTNAAKQSPVAGTKVGVGTVVTVEFSNSANIGD